MDDGKGVEAGEGLAPTHLCYKVLSCRESCKLFYTCPQISRGKQRPQENVNRMQYYTSIFIVFTLQLPKLCWLISYYSCRGTEAPMSSKSFFKSPKLEFFFPLCCASLLTGSSGVARTVAHFSSHLLVSISFAPASGF